MRSPHAIQWEQLFKLPADSALPLQARLRQAVVQAILEGRLPPGAALPSSRELAQLLVLSRNTITAAYMQLVDEGFLEARPRSGVFVAAQACSASAAVGEAAQRQAGQAPDWSRRVARSLVDRPTLSKPELWRRYRYPFVYGQFDPQLFPADDFRECCVRSLARSQLPHWTPDLETDDVADLVEQIRLRLLPKRGVFALKEEILVTVGAQQAFHLLTEALLDAGQRVGFEEPGYPHARNAFALRKPQFVPLPVDADGIVLEPWPAGLDLVFVTPSQQSPTTATLAMERRELLLQLAERDDFVIVEDDYEAENLYQGPPMPALKSMDRTGRVIYVGSISKSLSPGLRLGYIVAPRALISELRVLRHAMVRHPSAFLQHAYALFLSLGHHESHSRRVNQAMQERLAVLGRTLGEQLPEFRFVLPQGGASVWVHAPDWVDSGDLALIARKHDVLIEGGEVFFAQPPYPCPFFRLRLSSTPLEIIPAGVRALRLAFDELAQARGTWSPRGA